MGGNQTLNKTFNGTFFSELDTSAYGFLNNQTVLENNNTNMQVLLAYQRVLDHVNIVCYILICILGLLGNSLVIYVVLMYAKMKTVTNMYILNLAFSDILTMLPITATTVIVKHWIFGLVMCKIYYVLCAVNIFGGAFNLCVMSADRYIAVCYPIQSIRYRTPRIAFGICLCVWVMCILVMLPVIMYTDMMKHRSFKDKFSCRIDWPANGFIHSGKVFVWYSFILGFVIPVSLISLFYILVIIRLRKVGTVKKSNGQRRSRGRVTRLIFAIVAVYVLCWLPYWCFQVHGVIVKEKDVSISKILLINGFTILSYINSMLNPLLYAFLSENFRQSFVKAFKCVSFLDKTRLVCNEKSTYPNTSQTYMRAGTSVAVEERVELSLMCNNCTAAPELNENKMSSENLQDEHEFLKPHADF